METENNRPDKNKISKKWYDLMLKPCGDQEYTLKEKIVIISSMTAGILSWGLIIYWIFA